MHRTDRIDAWIARYLRDAAPRARSVIVTLFGDSLLPHRKHIWTGHLITLLAPFGINERLVRTSLYRLSEAGWVTAERRGRHSYYAPAPAGRRRFRDAYDHVYQPDTAWQGGWVIVVAANGVRTADRLQLRRELEWEGFASVAPGVFVRPADDLQRIRDAIHGLGLSRRLAIFEARAADSDRKAFADLALTSWALSPAAEAFADFVVRIEPVLPLLRRLTITPEQAFVLQTLMIDAFRRATLKDPRLPTALLPKDWPGVRARELCREVYLRLYPLTDRHLKTVLRMDGSKAVPDVVARRFGGLVPVGRRSGRRGTMAPIE